PIDQLLSGGRVLRALEQRNALRRRADALLRERDHHIVALGLGVERIDDEEDAAAGLPEPDRQRAAATALGEKLHARAQFLQVGESFFLVAPVYFEHRENA